MRRHVLATLLVVATALASAPADAEERAEAERERRWPETVPRVRWWEWAGSAALLGGSLALRFTVDVSGEPNWRGGFAIDDPVYDATYVTSPHLAQAWRDIGDIGYFGSFAWSAVDPLIAGFTYDWDTALQMTGMNVEAFAIYSTIISVSQIAVRRERPASTKECGTDRADELGVSCGGGANQNRSFIGGHTGTAATAATLTCIHHAQLPLWGGGFDLMPCVGSWMVTAMVFTSRTITGKHYVSDNVLGVTAGASSALVPYLLHYVMEQEVPDVEVGGVRPSFVMVVPTPEGRGAQLQMAGTLH